MKLVFPLLALMLFGPTICAAQKEENCSITPITNMVVGQDSTLAAGHSSDLVLMLKAVRNEDGTGMLALAGDGRVVMLEAGTGVEVRCIGKFDLVSIESGAQIGKQLWVLHGTVVPRKQFEQAKAKQAAQAAANQKALDARTLEEDRVKFLRECGELKNGTSILAKADLEDFQKECEEVHSGKPLAEVREEWAEVREARAQEKERQKSLAECDQNDAQIKHQGFALSAQETLQKKCVDVRSGKLRDLHH